MNEAALLAFVGKYLGCGRIGTNDANAGQCVGLVQSYLMAWWHAPAISGNAVDLLARAKALGYTVTKNGPINFPPPGAVVCWDGSWGAGYGHCAVVLAATANELAVFEQNDPTGAGCIVATHSYAGVAGWITWQHE